VEPLRGSIYLDNHIHPALVEPLRGIWNTGGVPSILATIQVLRKNRGAVPLFSAKVNI
jgi:hypothetical protein